MHQNDGHARALAGLDQGQRFQDFIERAEAAGHDHVGLGVFHEHHLAREEVLEGEDDIKIVVGVLFLRQADIKPDARRLAGERAFVGGLHQPGPPPLTTAKPASESLRPISSVRA